MIVARLRLGNSGTVEEMVEQLSSLFSNLEWFCSLPADARRSADRAIWILRQRGALFRTRHY